LEFLIGRSIHTLSDIIAFNKNNPRTKGMNQDYLIAAQATDGITNQTYLRIREKNKKSSNEYLAKVLDGNDLDAIVGPCHSENTLIIHNIGSIAGHPYITVSLKRVENTWEII